VMKDGRIVARGKPATVITPTLLAAVFGVIMRPPAGFDAPEPFVLPQFCMLADPASSFSGDQP
jgi:ABC-type cobalamin/Fe3+-siderophores transport system ATPase subunit